MPTLGRITVGGVDEASMDGSFRNSLKLTSPPVKLSEPKHMLSVTSESSVWLFSCERTGRGAVGGGISFVAVEISMAAEVGKEADKEVEAGKALIEEAVAPWVTYVDGDVPVDDELLEFTAA